ncbi:MAG: hypothetical protein HYY35_05015 [Deltaproteobacteria bacterium]|nr:hypothetical protein [Deltaproteobacteria bacterium]
MIVALSWAAAGADAIQRWKTPEGGLYFGDHPPAGSTLVQTIADTPSAAAPADAGVPSDLQRAAAEGRDIIRRREAERAAERQREAERAARLEELAAEQAAAETSLPFLIVDTFPPCRPGDRCFDPRRRRHESAGSWGRAPRPPGGAWSAVVQAPAVRPPLSRGGVLFGSSRREGSARRQRPAGH